jgi:ribosomal protein L39E
MKKEKKNRISGAYISVRTTKQQQPKRKKKERKKLDIYRGGVV